MTHKKFEVDLEDCNGAIRTLAWTLFDTPIVNKWTTIMSTRKEGPVWSKFDWANVGYSQEHLDKSWNRIVEVCQILNQSKSAGINEEWLVDYSRDNLNELHKAFHLLSENKPDDPLVREINYKVHTVENCIKNLTNNTARGYISLMFNIYQFVPLEENDFQYFDEYLVRPGQLAVGYQTVGKNLFHCAMDNDRKVLDEGMLRPKVNLGTEVKIVVGTVSKFSSSSGTRNMYYKWCDENNILETYGLDCRQPLHTGGEAVLGDALNFDPIELNDWAINNGPIRAVDWRLI